MEGITVDGGGGLRVGAGEEKVRDSVLVLRLTFVGTCSLFMDSDQTFHAIVLEYIRLADRSRILVDAWSQGPWRRVPLVPNGCRNCRRFAC